MFCGIFLFFVPNGNLIRYDFRVGKDNAFRICPICYTVEGPGVFLLHLYLYLFTYTDDQYDDILVVLEKLDAASREAGTAYTSGALEVITVIYGVCVV